MLHNVSRNQDYGSLLLNRLDHHRCPTAMRVLVAAQLIQRATKANGMEDVISMMLASWMVGTSCLRPPLIAL